MPGAEVTSLILARELRRAEARPGLRETDSNRVAITRRAGPWLTGEDQKQQKHSCSTGRLHDLVFDFPDIRSMSGIQPFLHTLGRLSQKVRDRYRRIIEMADRHENRPSSARTGLESTVTSLYFKSVMRFVST